MKRHAKAMVVGALMAAAACCGVAQKASAVPPNSTCATATGITSIYGGGTYTNSVTPGTTVYTGGPDNACDNGAAARFPAYWTFTPTSSGVMTVTQTNGATTDTATGVWTMAPNGDCAGSFTAFGTCLDDDFAAQTYNVTAGTTYLIQIVYWFTSFNPGATEHYDLKVTFVSNTIPLGAGSATPNPVVRGTSTVLQVAVTPASGGSADDVTSVTAEVSALSGNTSPDNRVLARDGATANWKGTVAVPASMTTGAKAVGFTINENPPATAPGTGSFSVTVQLPPPANDTACTATSIASLPYTSTLVDYSTATTDTGVNPSCDSGSNAAAKFGVWWTYTPPSSGSIIVNRVSPSSEDTVTSVWTGSCSGPTAFVGTNSCVDGDAAGGAISVVGGTTYYFLVSKFSTGTPAAGTTVGLSVSVTAAMTNDTACTATVATGNPYVSPYVGYSTATADAGINPSCDDTGNASAKFGVWWAITPSADAVLQVSRNSPSSEDTVTSIWTGGDCNAVTALAGTNACVDSDGAGFNVSVTAGTTYYVMVSKWGTGTPSASTLVGVRMELLPPIGICCNNTTGACTVLLTGSCAGTATQGTGTACSAGTPSSSCPALHTCCDSTTGACTITYGSVCPSGTALTGSGSSCAPGSSPCPASVVCCNGTSCSQALASVGCGGGVPQPDGSACSPANVCFPNNECVGAVMLTVGAAPTAGTTVGATASYPSSIGCSSSTIDVFYKFGALAGHNYGVSMLNDTDHSIMVLANCGDTVPINGGTTCASIDFDNFIESFTVPADGTYIVRIACFPGDEDAFTVEVHDNLPTGICCGGTSGACTVQINNQACASGSSLGTGTTCEAGTPSSSCPAAGICCAGATGGCSVIFGGACASGSTAGSGTTCEAGTPSSSCPATGSCCNNSSGACSLRYGADCAPGLVSNASTTCPAGLCPSTGACCSGAAGGCAVTLSSDCTGPDKVYFGAGTTCVGGPNASEAPNVILADGTSTAIGTSARTLSVSGVVGPISSLAVTLDMKHGFAGDLQVYIQAPSGEIAPLVIRAGGSAATCDAFEGVANGNSIDGVYIIDDTGTTTFAAAIVAGPEPLASGTYKPSGCADAPVSLSAAFSAATANGTWTLRLEDHYQFDACTLRAWGIAVNGGSAPPCGGTGACCSGAVCALALNVGACAGGAAAFHAGAACDSAPCGASAQMCCRGTTCLPVPSGTCTGVVAASIATPVGACGPNNALATCCYADYDHSGLSTIDDLFKYINVWLTQSPYSKIGGDGTAQPSIDDLFIFINYWLGGCS